MMIEQNKLKPMLEAILMVADAPMTTQKLAQLFSETEQPSIQAISEALQTLQEECETRGVELKKVANGYRYQAKQEFAPWISKLWEERPARYSRAFLETLVLIAYRQPVTRAEIEEVRGVTVSSHIVRSLLEREWIKVVGHRDVPGKPALLGTTKQFLDYFNLDSLQGLPTLQAIQDLDVAGSELAVQMELLEQEENAVAQESKKEITPADEQEENAMTEENEVTKLDEQKNDEATVESTKHSETDV
ncbi:MAG: SMC-Scp complex subunit ScpB [Gammaproteobacteria bacterium]|nr:SMC-Scp complex subunit ScpB [Gammaproteobacteria bacterium]